MESKRKSWRGVCRVWRYERIGKREFGEEGEMKREKGKEERRGRE